MTPNMALSKKITMLVGKSSQVSWCLWSEWGLTQFDVDSAMKIIAASLLSCEGWFSGHINQSVRTAEDLWTSYCTVGEGDHSGRYTDQLLYHLVSDGGMDSAAENIVHSFLFSVSVVMHWTTTTLGNLDQINHTSRRPPCDGKAIISQNACALDVFEHLLKTHFEKSEQISGTSHISHFLTHWACKSKQQLNTSRTNTHHLLV